MALPVETLRRPSFILLILNFFFSLIVFACIIDKCKPSSYCVYNDSHACNFAIGLGVFTFLLTLVFMAAELFQDTLGAMRRTIALAEMFLSGLLAFLWFVAFCYLLDQWRRDPGPPAFLGYAHWPSRVVNNAQAAIAFALFSWLSWMAAAYMHYTGQDNGDVGFRSPAAAGYSPFGGSVGGYQSGASA